LFFLPLLKPIRVKYLSLYNRKFLLVLVLVIIVLSGCSKDTGTDPIPPDPPANQDPIRVMQTIYTTESVGTLFTDTITFTYDNEGRVTSRSSAQGDYTEQFFYTNGKLTSLKNIGTNGTQEMLNKAVYSADGDTIMVDLVGNTQTDTIQLTYIFKDDKQTDFWTYLHFVDGTGCNCMPENHLQKEKWYYNTLENLSKKTLQTPPTNEENDWYTVLSWDDKKNPKYGQPKLNALALDLVTPMQSYGLHNVMSYSADGTTNMYNVEMTYNDEGYPLTFKYKDKDYISTRLVYNR
jgi:hypothetical protein